MIKKASALTAIFMMFSLAALAADVSGTWTGIFHSREGGAFETNLVLKASGDAFTGTLQQGNSDEIQIDNGKISGDQVSFTLTRGSGDKAHKINYTGKIDGSTMKLTVQPEGSTRTQEVTLTKK
jgi:hypothetical protein